MSVDVAPAPTFAVVGARTVPVVRRCRRSSCWSRSTEPSGAPVYTIALHAQVLIEPARRSYDDATRERHGRALRPARALVEDHRLDPVGRGRHAGAELHRRGRPSRCGCRAATTSRSPPRATATALRDGELPLDLHFNGTVFHRGEDGRLQIAMVPWSGDGALLDAVRGVADDDRPPLPGAAAGSRLHRETLETLAALPRRARPAVLRRDHPPTCSRRPADERDPLEPLVQSLLFEGYALYPYTPGATKNATPTPFGIVYPPAYAEGNQAHASTAADGGRCWRPRAGAELTGDVRFLQGSGADHQAIPRRLELGPTPLGETAAPAVRVRPARGPGGAALADASPTAAGASACACTTTTPGSTPAPSARRALGAR